MPPPIDAPAAGSAQLRRDLGLADAVGIGFGAIVGASAFEMANLRPFAPAGWPGTFEAAAILFFAYGIANIAALRMPREATLYSDAIPIAGAGACAVLALSLTLPVIASGLMVLALGFLLRALLRHAFQGQFFV